MSSNIYTTPETNYNSPGTPESQGSWTQPASDPGHVPTSGPRHAADETKAVADHSAAAAHDVADTALAKASDSKDVLLERGGDVVAVAKDEAAELAREARDHVRSLWTQASGQINQQVANAQKQFAEVLHAWAGELGEMASKSEQHGPITSLAKQAASRGGSLSHWLSNAETGDMLVEVRRLARRRPLAFLVGAAAAGILVGRLGRGLMAADDSAPAGATSVPMGRPVSPATVGGVNPTSVPVLDGDALYRDGGTASELDRTGYENDDTLLSAEASMRRTGGAGETLEGGQR